ncbi:hypothetical protein LSAT2_004413 [Lamellibrachia satsuma]|nr:hypothetical protein LSAT2_004413 [Lamellibrachia satsuma]
MVQHRDVSTRWWALHTAPLRLQPAPRSLAHSPGAARCPVSAVYHEESDEAWWQVDLGDVYVINSVIIVNYDSSGDNNFLYDISINIGNSSSVTDHTRCGEQRDKVPASTNVTIPCEGWGRHVSIRKYGGTRKDALLFCEVFVIGYKYRDCTSACEGSCSPVIGCDKCQAGKKMPDCKQDCDAGTYGNNCAERCSQHCAAGSAPCDRVTGTCSGGCQQWYGLDTCKAEIKRVDYSSTPENVSASSSSVSVSWSQSGRVPPGLESYYQYVVEATDGQSTKEVTRQFVAGQSDQTADINDLMHNTNYNIKVRIDAEHNTQKRKGYAGDILRVKTKCKAPAKPKIDRVTPTDPVGVGSKMGSLHVTWQVIGDSGCDNFKKLLVQYKKNSGQWQDKLIAGVTETQITIDNLQSGYYSIRLSVTNNEDIESFSNTMTSTVGLTRATTSDKDINGGNGGCSCNDRRTGSDDGATKLILGVIIAVLVVIILVMAALFIIIRLRNGSVWDLVCKRKPKPASNFTPANVRQPAPEATISRNVTAADVAEPEAADGHEYEQLELEQNSFGRGSTEGIYERVGQQ